MGNKKRSKSEINNGFSQAVTAESSKTTVTLDIDNDVLQWLKADSLPWKRQINDLLRFYKDTSEIKAAAFFEPHEPDITHPTPTAP